MSRYRSSDEALLEEARSLEGRGLPLEAALERTRLPALVHDGERVLDVNRALCDWLGYEAADLAGAALGVFSEPSEEPSLLAALAGGGADAPELPHVQRFRSKAGEIRVGQALARGIAHEHALARLVLIQPWSVTLRSNELLGLLEAAVDQLNDIVFITEADPIDTVGRRIVFVNAAYSRATGFEPKEVVGRTPNVTVGEATQRDALKRIEASLRAGKPVHEQLIKYTKDGSKYWVELTIIPVFDREGKHTHWLSVQRDISETKRLHEKLVETERLASAGMLAAGLAHEINNPLTSVTSSLEWLIEQVPALFGDEPRFGPALAPPDREAILAALADARSGAQRVDATLRYLSELTGTHDDVMQPVEVCDLLDAALERLHAQLQVPGEVIRDFGRASFVLGSELRLTHVFFNLLLNAAQALDHENLERNRIVLCVRDEAPARVLIEVTDTGSGIPPDIARKLFSPFVSSRPRGLGKGLGLFMAREIVRSMSGELGYRSEPGRGTTFSVRLPSGGSRMRATEPVEPLASALGQTRVLVVAKELGVARALRHQHALGLVVAVESGAAALELLEAGRGFDIAFAELMAPELDGIELRDRVSAVDPRLARRFVLMCPSERANVARRRATLAGSVLLEQPFDLVALRGVVAGVLGLPARG